MPPLPNNPSPKPVQPEGERPIDRLIRSTRSLLGKDVFLVGKARIASWKALTMVTFVAGFFGALVWAVQFEPERLTSLVAQLQPPQVENMAQFTYEDEAGTRTTGSSNRVAVRIIEQESPPPPGPVCGNGQCESGEDSNTCAQDCPAPTPQPESQPPAGNVSLSLQPQSGSVKVGDTFDVAIRLNTAGQEIDGVDLHYLRFPTTLLEVVDSDAAAPGVQVQSGAILDLTDINQVDNAAGTIDFSRTAAGGTTFKGAGTLAVITFAAKAAGTAALSFDATPGNTTDTNVAAGEGTDIMAQATGASYEIKSQPRQFKVKEKKQGKKSGKYEGQVTIIIYQAGTENKVAEFSCTANNLGECDMTEATRIPDGTYDVVIKLPRHLTKKLRNVAWPPVQALDFGEMSAGNLQDVDDCVNSLDYSILNSKWGTADQVADINGDGRVNTLDFSLMNRNWGKCGE